MRLFHYFFQRRVPIRHILPAPSRQQLRLYLHTCAHSHKRRLLLRQSLPACPRVRPVQIVLRHSVVRRQRAGVVVLGRGRQTAVDQLVELLDFVQLGLVRGSQLGLAGNDGGDEFFDARAACGGGELLRRRLLRTLGVGLLLLFLFLLFHVLEHFGQRLFGLRCCGGSVHNVTEGFGIKGIVKTKSRNGGRRHGSVVVLLDDSCNQFFPLTGRLFAGFGFGAAQIVVLFFTCLVV
mmetsp:Transcript_2317/g.3439  ORF Transcript_2317/g.3439 Transcript_2317/m.3439 type:complete len:235 (+) Transcript_2317:618-1322(+)